MKWVSDREYELDERKTAFCDECGIDGLYLEHDHDRVKAALAEIRLLDSRDFR